jgi:ribosomal protein S12 methylthiotransferase
VEEVLIEGKTGRPDFPFYGRTRFQAPEIDGITYVRAKKLTEGELIRCKITAAEIYDLYAEKAGD